ncbi:hypothetical protein K1719_014156 [Acacia pycnantha]|nr:hypothetical protein K1719_014156 [Acacia pycnantha]
MAFFPHFSSAISVCKFILAAMVMLLLFSFGKSTTYCPGPCFQMQRCDRYCRSIGFKTGECIVEQHAECCCSS